MKSQPEPTEVDSASLARSFAAGEVSAFEYLYEALGEKVFRLMYRMTRNRDTAADLTHDTFVRVMEKRAQFNRDGSLPGWVFRIATNLATDGLRKRVPFSIDDPGAELSGESRFESMETRLTLRQALNRLPEAQRLVLVLHDIDGYKHDEIAEMLEIAPGTSKARLSRGRTMMRTALQGTT